MDHPAQPTLNFITVSHPDELKDQDIQHRIRRFAMGKVGKARRKSRAGSRKNEIVLEFRGSKASPTAPRREFDALNPGSICLSVGKAQQKHIARNELIQLGGWASRPDHGHPGLTILSRVGLGSIDPFASLPFNMDSQESELCYNFFWTNHNYPDLLRAAWSFAGFYDEMAFRTFLSNSTLYLSMLRSGKILKKDTTESLRLHTKALSSLCQKLDDPAQHTSDGLIGGMSGFLFHDYVIGDFVGWNRHMDGLLKMIELRGGFQTLNEQNFRIVLSWADICGCFSQDIPPRLPLPLPWLQSIALPLKGDSHDIQNSVQMLWRNEFPETQEWLSIYDLLYVLLHDSKTPSSSWIVPVLHRFLSMRVLKPEVIFTRAMIVEELCRLGTLLFLAPIWRSSGIHPVRTTQIRRSFLKILKTHLVEWGQCRVILLWTLAHAVRESQETTEQREFAIMLLMVSRSMGLLEWKDVNARVESVLSWGNPGSVWQEAEKAVQEALLGTIITQ